MATITGIFADGESALLAGERVREVAGPRATVRVLLPNPIGLVEVAVIADRTGSLRVALAGVALGVIGMICVLALGLGWLMAIVGLTTGVAMGAMLGLWLTGERFPARMVANGAARTRLADLARAGQAVVTAVVAPRQVRAVRATIADAGGQVGDGFVDQIDRAPYGGEPLPT